jgi:hypothetical protein
MRRTALWLFPLLAVFAFFGFLSLRNIWRASEARECAVCRRPVHARTKTIGEFEGKREIFCCPACALTAHRQSGRPVRVLRFTDFETGAPLDPRRAVLVSGSDQNLCMRAHVMVDQEKQAHGAHFDRCSPSILAFATGEAAGKFIAVHGGHVEYFETLSAAYAK